MKSKIKDWLIVLVLLLDEAVAVVVVLLVLRALEIKVPLSVAIAVALLFGALAFVIHKAIIPTFHRKKVAGAEGLIGLGGEVIEPLTPKGLVKVKGEYWKAKSVGGEEVEILGLERLTLKVKRKGE